MDININVNVTGDMIVTARPVSDADTRQPAERSGGEEMLAGMIAEGMKGLAGNLLDELAGELQEIDFACGFLEYLLDQAEAELAEDDADEEKDVIVMILTPGKPPRVRTFTEMADEMPCYYEKFQCVEDFAGMGLNLYCRKDQIMKVGDGNYLVGPAIVCREDGDSDVQSLSGEDICRLMRYAEKNSAVLGCDGKDVPAIRIGK